MDVAQNLQHPLRRRALRTKTGCLTCRRRKKKCDEKDPVCTPCLRNDLVCEKGSSFRDQSATIASTTRRSNRHSPPSTSATPGYGHPEHIPSATPSPGTLNSAHREASLPSASRDAFDHISRAGTPHYEEDVEGDVLGFGATMDGSPGSLNLSPASSVLSPTHLVQDVSELQLLPMSRSMRINPPDGIMHSELLSHYLTETSIAVSNGATEVNPFIVQLIPLAFTDPLLLQLLLAQAAAHRAEAACSGPSAVVKRYADSARTYYTQALRAFRNALGTYIMGNKERLTILAIGSLTLCVTELARGDMEGASFSHLQAAKSLLMDLVTSTNSVPKKLMNFIVEFYLFNATLSMISMDVADRPHLDTQLQQAGHSLVGENYVGHMCGCWLSLLMLIPDIVDLKHQIDSQAGGPGQLPANCVVAFAGLQVKIAQYQPAAQVEEEVILSGKVYQQCIMLYLLTTLSVPGQSAEGAHREAIESAIDHALEHLKGIPLAARINTTLLWPLTVLGSCIKEDRLRNSIRARLRSMSETLGFATMRNTWNLLEHIWKEGRSDTGPWTMWRAMRERQMWLLFA